MLVGREVKKMETMKALIYEPLFYHKSEGEACKTQHVTLPRCCNDSTEMANKNRLPEAVYELINDGAQISRWKSGIQQHLYGSLVCIPVREEVL